jgi:SAM-dependent methyltransferase
VGRELDLLAGYPKSPRDVSGRGATRTEEDRRVARRFGREFFDGERRHGYGGFHYHPRFWQPVVPDFARCYGLRAGSRILDVGCAKGFMLFDFRELVPGVEVVGLDVSDYALRESLPAVRPRLLRADARALPFRDRSFDLVISINTIHNLGLEDCARALREIERVGRGRSFVSVDAWRDDEEKARMEMWALTARTIMHVDDWRRFFAGAGYRGDYSWFIP